jgi:hypothetical protein
MTDDARPAGRLRLLDLHPRWVLIHRWDTPDGTQHFTNGDSRLRHGGGLSFDCPAHRDHRLVVFFENPIDGLPPEQSVPHRWQRTGETFETLTLAPSVNAQVADPTCWHGFIANGEIQ